LFDSVFDWNAVQKWSFWLRRLNGGLCCAT
jgi:hypothetical protein